MSQRKRSSKSLSQSRTSQLSQIRLDEMLELSQNNIDEMVNDCVRFLLYRAGNRQLIRKADLQKNVVVKSSRNFEQIMEKSRKILNEVYGYNLILCDTSQSTKAYVISNALLHIDYNENKSDPKKIILMLVLAHIFMSNMSTTDASLYSFLRSLKIDPERKNPVFGDVKDYLFNVLVKQKYLSVETDSISHKVTILWGMRAEKEVSKHQLLKFVCKMYGNRLPQSWEQQFKLAEEQGFENDPQIDD